jgi:hypothetical protein
MPNITTITAPRVPLVDSAGMVSREWYRFFLNLFTLTGNGQTTPSLTAANAAIAALQVAPSDSDVVSQLAELAKTVQGIQSAPSVILPRPVMSNTATLDFPATAAQSSSDLTISVPGAVPGDIVSLGVPAASTLTNSNYTAWVSLADTVNVRFNNYSSGSQDPASGVFAVMVTRL